MGPKYPQMALLTIAGVGPVGHHCQFAQLLCWGHFSQILHDNESPCVESNTVYSYSFLVEHDLGCIFGIDIFQLNVVLCSIMIIL